MWVQHLSSLEFLSYVAFFAVVVGAVCRFVPGKRAPVRAEPYTEEELARHDPCLAKYFVAGGAFLVLGAAHMVVKNLPWTADWLAGAGYPGHLVRDLSNTHVMIVGGGTLIATGLTWRALPRIVRRPLASDGLAHWAFWLTALGLLVFYVALVGDGIAMGRLVEHGWAYPDAKAHLGKWYKVPVGVGAGVMGLGYWCFAANVVLTVFQARLVRVPKPDLHLWKYFATGAAALTVGTVQGVIQVTPANADWLYRAGHAGEWIDPISHAHMNLVTGLTMLVAGALLHLAPQFGGSAPTRRVADGTWAALLASSLAFYGSCLYLGLHEGGLVVRDGLTPQQAEDATALHGPLLVGSGVLMFGSFWLLLEMLVRAYRGAARPLASFVLAGCAALAVGTLQGPIQAAPAVNELLDRGGEAGDAIVNLHAQLNMLGGLMVLLIGAAVALVGVRAFRPILVLVAAGMAAYYGFGIAFSAAEAVRVAAGSTYGAAVRGLEPWPSVALAPAAAAALAGFALFARGMWRGTAVERAAGRTRLRAFPSAYTGRIPARVRRRSPAALAAYELPLGLLGFPGVGWLFAGFPVPAVVLLCAGPAVAWAVLPVAFTPYGEGPLRSIGWRIELVYLPATALLSAALLYRAHRRRRLKLLGPGPPRRGTSYRTKVAVAAGSILLLLVSLPFVPAVAGLGDHGVRYTLQPRLTREVTGQFLVTPRGPVKLFAWQDPQATYPSDALRLRAGSVRSLLVRAAALDATHAYRLYDVDRSRPLPLVRRGGGGGRALSLVPARPLRPGRYVFTATHEGMFGGTDYAYLTIVAPGEPESAISPHATRTAPVARAVPPVAATLVALAFAALLVRSFRRRPALQKALWACGFLLFGVAAACEAVAQRSGWTPLLFRGYYLCGGVLTVAALGAGSAMLQLRPRARDALLGGLAVAAASAAVTVFLAPVDERTLVETAAGRPPPNGALAGHAFLWAIALNSFGTALLVGGALVSIARRRNVRANVWIAAGALVVALATGLSRGGDYSYAYVGQLVGISLMFAGFTLPGRAKPQVRSRPAVRVAAR